MGTKEKKATREREVAVPVSPHAHRVSAKVDIVVPVREKT